MKKRVLSLLTILALILSFVPVHAAEVYYDAYGVIDSLNNYENVTSTNANNLLEFKNAGQYAKYYVDFGNGADTLGCVVKTCFAANYEGRLQMIIDGKVVAEIPGHNNGSWNNNYKTRHFYIDNPKNITGKKVVELKALGGFGAFKQMQFFTDASTLDIGDPLYYNAYSDFNKKQAYNTTTVKKYNLAFGENQKSLALRVYREFYTTDLTASEITLKVGDEVVGSAPAYYVTADNGNQYKATYIDIKKPELLVNDAYLTIEMPGTAAGYMQMWFVETANPYENMLSEVMSGNTKINNAFFGDKTVESVEITYINDGWFEIYADNKYATGFTLPKSATETTTIVPISDATKYSGVVSLEFRPFSTLQIKSIKFNYATGPAAPTPNFDILGTEFTAENCTASQGVSLGECISDTNTANSYAKWEAVDFGEDEKELDVSIEYATTAEFSGGLITLYVDSIDEENIIAQIVAENRYGIDWDSTKVEMIPMTKFPTGVRDLIMTVTPSDYAATSEVDTDIYKIKFLTDSNSDEYRTYTKKISKYNTVTAKNEPSMLQTTLTFANTNENLDNSSFIMAVYDADMKLVGVDWVPIDTVVGYNSAVAEVPYSVIGDSTGYTVKGFVWNGDNYSPVADGALKLTEISNDTFTAYPVEVTTDLLKEDVSILCLGDSITMGQYTNPAVSYHDYWEENYNITSINAGVGGSTVTTASDASNWASFIKRLNSLDTSADMVFVMGGTNDCIRGISIGNIDDTGVTTFYGAYNTVINSLKTNFPNKTIVLSTPLYYSGTNWNTNGSWSGSKNVEKYGAAVKAIAKKYKLPVVDMQVDEMDFSTKGAAFMPDGLHPNNYCHALIGDYILDELFEMGILKETDYDSLYGDTLSISDFDTPVVSDFYGNKKAGVSITFDDALYDSALYYNEAFKTNGLCGTAMLVANDLENETGESIEAWQELFDEGYIEAGNHSKTHKIPYSTGAGTYTSDELVDDITGGYKLLKESFPNEKLLTYASPWSQTTDEATNEVKKNHYANRLQGGLFDPNPDSIDSLYAMPSYAVTSEDTAETLNAKVDNAIAQNKWYIHLLHGALDTKPASKVYHIVKSEADEHFEYLASKKDEIWVATLGDMVAYIYEHKNVSVNYSWIRENAMSISITDGLDNDLFDVPLTVKIEVPANWSKIKVTQGKNTNTVTCSNGYAYIDAIPDNGNVLIVKE